ncbi:DUF3105 domain-containing protein [Actinotalea ferrariae]|uniref:DUF3105 domain-containing protein n=1 Tax=Actinotalea ferrariae TaxID=1386098 RepID=UPI001C8CB4AD|nr:DUF3105 domain-containing protein [Actinotalea ferrariae]MBX9246092.1 DUF3105 domain-containing protein [Actinotalea ferrariae]
MLIIGISVAVALALIIPAAVLIIGEQGRQAELETAAEQPIEGVVETEVASATHVQTDVTYEQSPPVGGDHHPTWQNCGFYTAPVTDEHAVHSLEHGAVWITYGEDLPEADVQRLEELTERHSYLLVSPHEDAAPLTVSAWGLQLEIDSTEDERLDIFLRKYLQGPQTLEPGASCSGGIGA